MGDGFYVPPDEIRVSYSITIEGKKHFQLSLSEAWVICSKR